MKNSGLTRRIDELGRIVIPKEIRRMLAIRDGENLEIIVEDDKIIIKKYHYIQNITELGKRLINIYKSISENEILITDREKVVVCSCNKNLIAKKIDINLMNLIDNRESIYKNLKLKFETEEIDGSVVVVPIINETDCVGLVILFNEENKIVEDEVKIAKIISKILAEKLNIS